MSVVTILKLTISYTFEMLTTRMVQFFNISFFFFQTTQLLRKFKLQLRASRAGVPEGPSPANEATPTPVLEEEATCSSRLAPSEEKSGAKEDEPGAGNTSSFNWYVLG